MWILQSLCACQSKMHGKKQESYPARMAPMSAMNHSAELNPRMPTPWKRSRPSCKTRDGVTAAWLLLWTKLRVHLQIFAEHSTEGRVCALTWGNSHWKTPQEPRWNQRKFHITVPLLSGQENRDLLSSVLGKTGSLEFTNRNINLQSRELPVPLGWEWGGERRSQTTPPGTFGTSWECQISIMARATSSSAVTLGYEIPTLGVPAFNSLSQSLVLSQSGRSHHRNKTRLALTWINKIWSQQ